MAHILDKNGRENTFFRILAEVIGSGGPATIIFGGGIFINRGFLQKKN